MREEREEVMEKFFQQRDGRRATQNGMESSIFPYGGGLLYDVLDGSRTSAFGSRSLQTKRKRYKNYGDIIYTLP